MKFACTMFLRKLRCLGICSKLSLDSMPIILIPLLNIIASFSLSWTIGVFICTIIGLWFIQRKFSQIRPRSTFFIVWLVTSVIWLILVFNVYVIAMNEILPEENFILVVLITLSVGFLYHSKMHAQKTLLPFNKAYIDDAMSDKEIDCVIDTQHIDQPFFCRYCQANVQNKNHCLWLNCCIGPENEKFFILGNIFGLLSLIYGSNLSLTTICHPYIIYYPYIRLLLPDDCSDVYVKSSTSISFVISTYCMVMVIQIMWYFFKRILKIFGIGYKWCGG